MNGFVSIFFDKQNNSKPTTTINKISKVDHVTFAHLVTGPVDAIAFLQAPDSGAFRDTLLAINAIPGVDHTITSVVL